MPGAGWTGTLLPRLSRLMDEIEQGDKFTGLPVEYNPALAWGPDGARKASPNHEAEAWGMELLFQSHQIWKRYQKNPVALDERARLHTEMDRLRKAVRVVIDHYVPRELGVGTIGIGLWASEQGCPDAHSGQHLVGVSAVVLANEIIQSVFTGDNANTLSESDDRLLTDLDISTTNLLLANAGYLLSIADPRTLTVWGPGMRSLHEPVSSAATSWLCELKGMPHQVKSLQTADGNGWQFDNYLGTRILRCIGSKYPNSISISVRLEPIPVKLKYKVSVYRNTNSGAFAAFMDAPTAKDRVLWTIFSPSGKKPILLYGRDKKSDPEKYLLSTGFKWDNVIVHPKRWEKK